MNCTIQMASAFSGQLNQFGEANLYEPVKFSLQSTSCAGSFRSLTSRALGDISSRFPKICRAPNVTQMLPIQI
jgi:hypothetical protein